MLKLRHYRDRVVAMVVVMVRVEVEGGREDWDMVVLRGPEETAMMSMRVMMTMTIPVVLKGLELRGLGQGDKVGFNISSTIFKN